MINSNQEKPYSPFFVMTFFSVICNSWPYKSIFSSLRFVKTWTCPLYPLWLLWPTFPYTCIIGFLTLWQLGYPQMRKLTGTIRKETVACVRTIIRASFNNRTEQKFSKRVKPLYVTLTNSYDMKSFYILYHDYLSTIQFHKI